MSKLIAERKKYIGGRQSPAHSHVGELAHKIE
jgi:hypothetical protein